MTDHSVPARANAINMEVKKDGLSQRQNGDWQLRFTVASIDMDQRLTSAPMGTRFVAVLVELNDDETPVDHKAEERDKWKTLGPARQAGIRCKDAVFWAWLSEEGFPRGMLFNVINEAGAAAAVRGICDVTSRSELDLPSRTQSRLEWHDIDRCFQAWRVREHG